MLDTYTGKNWQVQFSVKGEDYMFGNHSIFRLDTHVP